jgi:hypothetical protein
VFLALRKRSRELWTGGPGQGGRGPGLGGDPLPQGRLLLAGRVRALGEAELLDCQRPPGGDLGGPPDHAALSAAQRTVQGPAASDEPLAGVV